MTDSTFSKEELEQAKQELAALDPAEWLEIKSRTEPSEDDLPEAGGVAWTNLHGDNGGQINLTARGRTPISAFQKLMAGVAYAMQHSSVHWTPYPVRSGSNNPAPQIAVPPLALDPEYQSVDDSTDAGDTQPSQGPNVEVIQVSRVLKQLSLNNKPFLKVMGGQFSRYGVTAWPETFPPSFQEHFNAMTVGVEEPAPDIMRNAWIEKTVDNKGKERRKVTAFARAT